LGGPDPNPNTAPDPDPDPNRQSHNYDNPDSGYFSYFFPLTSRKPRDLVEEAIISLQASLSSHIPAIKNSSGAEWWVHKRGHGHAHQLHYDTDENFLHSEGYTLKNLHSH